ncbi:unnamed protein product [Brugia pahangi]|uniref:Uncharacterized protein n=1 Tax=Brugia pahangi TaxID=6280 RepID=A0A0N4TA70_BRUPA|nr:unnamed protein product [Brugia pahangi]
MIHVRNVVVVVCHIMSNDGLMNASKLYNEKKKGKKNELN